MSQQTEEDQSIDDYTVVFVPYREIPDAVKKLGTATGGTVTTPREIKRTGEIRPSGEMIDAAVEIESERHLLELLDEHFEGEAFSVFVKLNEYMERASDEKLIEDLRGRLSEALALTRGHVPDRVKNGDLETLEEYRSGLQGDIDVAQDNLDVADSYRRHIDQ